MQFFSEVLRTFLAANKYALLATIMRKRFAGREEPGSDSGEEDSRGHIHHIAMTVVAGDVGPPALHTPTASHSLPLTLYFWDCTSCPRPEIINMFSFGL